MIEKADLLASKVRDVSEYIGKHMYWLPELKKRVQRSVSPITIPAISSKGRASRGNPGKYSGQFRISSMWKWRRQEHVAEVAVNFR